MPLTLYDPQIVLYLNDAWTSSTPVDMRSFSRFCRDFASATKAPDVVNILLIGDGGSSIAKHAKEVIGGISSTARVVSTDVSLAGKPWVPDSADDVSMKLDTTEKFTAPKRLFHIVLGRRVVCLCGVHLGGGPCGFPSGGAAEAAKFLRRIGKSLAPGGVAYLHGDPPGMTDKAWEYWLAAKAALAVYGPAADGGGKSQKDYFDVDLIGAKGSFLGIKVTKKAAPSVQVV